MATNFDDIYKTYSPQIFRVCMGYVNDHDQAKDLTQETFIAVWKGLPSFRGDSQITTWIYRIATNTCLRSIEKSKRIITTELPINLPEVEVKEETIEDKLSFLYHCIAQLEETERIIISLILEGLPQAEIAAIVGLSNENVRVKVYRIKNKLADKFKLNGQFE